MAAVADGEHQRVRARKVHRRLNVGHTGATGNECRTSVDVAVPDTTGVLVRRVIAGHQLAAKCRAQHVDVLVGEEPPAVRNSGGHDVTPNRY